MQLKTRIKHKRDTAARWAANNPVLLDGELIIVETTDGYTRLKIGDGTSTYGQLPFTDENINEQIADLASSVTALDNSKVTGPARAVSNNVAIFDGTTGKLVKDSGLTIGVSVPADAKFTDTTYSTGNTTTAGITKLYTSTGTATDGAMTQSAVKSALDLKANLASPTFTGTPKAPTAAAGTNTTQVATTAFVTTAVANKTSVSGNAGTATKLAKEVNIALSGDVTGSVAFDGSNAVTITTTVADDSHNHVISNVDGLQSALDAKAPLASPALTGTPTAPTAAAGTNTTQVATTAFVSSAIANLVDSAPETLNTLGELATALSENVGVTDALNEAIGSKANDADVVKLSGNQTIAGTKTFSSKITGSISGNAGTATKLAAKKNISLTGDVTGTAQFDGSTDASITASISDSLKISLGELTIDDIVISD